jgi:hypothetical protein
VPTMKITLSAAMRARDVSRAREEEPAAPATAPLPPARPQGARATALPAKADGDKDDARGGSKRTRRRSSARGAPASPTDPPLSRDVRR